MRLTDAEDVDRGCGLRCCGHDHGHLALTGRFPEALLYRQLLRLEGQRVQQGVPLLPRRALEKVDFVIWVGQGDEGSAVRDLAHPTAVSLENLLDLDLGSVRVQVPAYGLAAGEPSKYDLRALVLSAPRQLHAGGHVPSALADLHIELEGLLVRQAAVGPDHEDVVHEDAAAVDTAGQLEADGDRALPRVDSDVLHHAGHLLLFQLLLKRDPPVLEAVQPDTRLSAEADEVHGRVREQGPLNLLLLDADQVDCWRAGDLVQKLPQASRVVVRGPGQVPDVVDRGGTAAVLEVDVCLLAEQHSKHHGRHAPKLPQRQMQRRLASGRARVDVGLELDQEVDRFESGFPCVAGIKDVMQR
mmetsp:Transcript_98116/g.245963  ORF Transcript_98116/g.245963 Transcript_98116/m.245963 type:complete len:357 (+) Transcript_98116:321-1391(+)